MDNPSRDRYSSTEASSTAEPASPVSETPGAGRAAERFEIFEQVALERLQAGADATKPASFLPLPVRLTAIAAAAIAGVGVLWSVLARVPVQVNGTAALVPLAGLGSLTAPTNGILRYQVSGIGPDQLPAAQRQHNALLKQYWGEDYVAASTKIISLDRLNQLARGALLQDPGQQLILPENLDDQEAFDQSDKNLVVSYPSNTVLAHIIDSVAYQELNAALLTAQPTVALQVQQQRERLQRAGSLQTISSLQNKQQQTLQKELQDRQSLYARYLKLWEKGYLPSTQLLDEQARINGLKNQLLGTRSTLLSTESNRQDVIEQSQRAKLSNIESRSTLESKLVQFLEKTTLFAPDGGFYLLAANFNNDSLVKAGEEILSYTTQPPALPSVVPVFLDGSAAQQVNEGMRILLTPKGISRAQYGGIPGTLVAVNKLPLLGDGLIGAVGSRALVNAIQQQLPTPYLVRVRLDQAEPLYCQQALSRRCYRWSSGRLPPHPVRLATLADVQITTDHQRPIEFVMPALRRAFGLVVDNQ